MTTPLASDDDRRRVGELIGRMPMGAFAVVRRDVDGDPVVIANAPLLDDGTPMPTRYWLVGQSAMHAVSVLEAEGGVRWAEAVIPPDDIDAAHRRHAAARDALVPDDHVGPRPTGGVGGTRTGVKCLHAHYACYLAGEDDPVGRWVAERLSEATVNLQPQTTSVTCAGVPVELPIGLLDVANRLARRDPPDPADLTNALGAVTDHIDDIVLRSGVTRGSIPRLTVTGPLGAALAALEVGAPRTQPVDIDRHTLEELFRLLATDDAEGRASHPGPDVDQRQWLLPALVHTVAISRRLGIASIRLGDDHQRSVRS